ncbi:MAG: hypothetical protein KDK08_05850 [Rhizobiaceae bacterium]|nr:hypothetical protein [Rhizobiaceae bacterium]MCC0000984.1 hypothetical protein [Methylobacteriaceae bacterium]
MTDYAPIYKIMKDGVDITDHFNDRATSIMVELNSGRGEGADRFSVVVDDRDFAVASPHIGDRLAIYMGFRDVETGTSRLAYLGLYEIGEVTYMGTPKAILITGTSVGMNNALKSQELKFHDNMTVGDVLGQLAKKGGVTLRIDPDLAEKKITKNQQGISGFALMTQLESEFGAMAKFQDGKLIFSKRDSGVDADGDALAAMVLRPYHFGQWSVKHTDRANYTDVKAAWWDKDKHETTWESKSTGESDDAGEKIPYRLNRRFNTKEEAQEAIDAKIGILNRASGEATITLAMGSPWVREQMRLIITGMRPGVNGTYVTDKVTHTFQKTTGITTQILALPPGDGVDMSDKLEDGAVLWSPDGSQTSLP